MLLDKCDKDIITIDSTCLRISEDVIFGSGVKLASHVNLYGCEIGDNTRIGCFVEIQRGAKVGARCKISSHTFICAGVTIEDDVFVGHVVMFTNDRCPRATAGDGRVAADGDWQCLSTLVQQGASIGSGCTILAGLTIGALAMIGAGSTVTRGVLPSTAVAGNPARPLKRWSGESADHRAMTAEKAMPVPISSSNP